MISWLQRLCGKCPHCGSRNIRRRYRQHRRYNWRCRRCNRVFRRPKRSVWLWMGAAAVILMVAAYVMWQGIIPMPSTTVQVDESVDKVVKPVMPTATPEVVATQTPVQLVMRADTPIAPVMQPDSTITPEATHIPMLTHTPTLSPTHTPVPTSTATPTTTPVPTDIFTPTPTPMATFTSTPKPTRTPWPTWTPWPTYTPRPTRTPTPTQIAGRADLYKPIYPPNHMAAVQWNWTSNYNGFQSIDFDFTIHNNIDADDLRPHYGLYLMLDSSAISGTWYYFGIQTDVSGPQNRGRGKGLIFSRWETRDLANVKVADGGWSTSSGNEGDFVGVRKPYHWGAGDYRVRIAADGEDEDGKWFGLWITDKATGETTWCGSLRFPYKNGKASLDNAHVSVAEIYGDPVSIKPIDIPEWHITMQKPMADGSRQPTDAHISYTNWDGVSASAPNTDIIYDKADSAIHIYVGGATERTTKEGWISLGR